MKQNVRNTHFPMGMFAKIFGIMLLFFGVHMGLIVLFQQWLTEWLTTAAPIAMMVYWAVIALGVTMFIRREMKRC